MQLCSSRSAQTVSWPVLREALRLLRMKVSRGSGGLRVVSETSHSPWKQPPTSVLVGNNLCSSFLLHGQKFTRKICWPPTYTGGICDRAVRVAKRNTDCDPLSGVVLCTHSYWVFFLKFRLCGRKSPGMRRVKSVRRRKQRALASP